MATIVWHRERETKYILLGAGFGAYKATTPGPIAGNLLPITDAGKFTYALVSDEEGDVSWVDTRHIHVISIDGVAPSDVLSE